MMIPADAGGGDAGDDFHIHTHTHRERERERERESVCVCVFVREKENHHFEHACCDGCFAFCVGGLRKEGRALGRKCSLDP
jgi:hypothetical protein